VRIPRRATAAVVTLAVAGVCWAGYAARADDPSYRTVRASVGDVEETLTLAGTVEPAGRADLAFATSGTVASIAVTAGQKVGAGAVLGTLESGALRKQVQHARAAVAAARAQLEADIDAQTQAVSDATDGGSSPQAPTAPQAPAGPSDQPSQQPSPQPSEEPSEEDPDLLATLAEQQRAVLAAQSAVSASLATAATALAAQQAACVDVSTQACADALLAVQAAQQQVSTDQQGLQDALDALGATLTAALDARATPASVTSGTPDAGIVLVAEVSPTVTAATLARDQASIDQAQADLVAAQQELAMATVKAPFAGRVVAVEADAGDSVAAGTDVFVLVSQGTTTVQVAASSVEVEQLEVGQHATATPAGAEETLAGEVTQVSSIPDDEGTYAVTLTLDRKRLQIPTGLTATAAVVTGTATDVVVVPASAVADGTVTVVEDGGSERTPVTVGVVGRTEVEITDGLEEGDEVALADLSRPLPTGGSEGGLGGLRGGGPGGPPVIVQRDVPRPQ
jgi:HlyD family secretion protein